MSKTMKQILAGIMIFGDLFLMLFFLFDLLEGNDFGIDLFLLIFLSIDTLLSVDYIRGLNQKEQLEDRIERTEIMLDHAEQKNMDHRMAEEIRNSTARKKEAEKPAEEPDPEELMDLLQGDPAQQERTRTH